MLTCLKVYFRKILQSFWLVPAGLIIGSILAAFVMTAVDSRFTLEGADWAKFVMASTPDGARSVLTTIAGSMITVAGVILSTTVVVLTLASQQFGPRLLKNFVEDRVTQFVIGLFSACFIYCLLILRNIRSGDFVFIPHFSVLFAVVTAIGSICLMIYFVHHVSVEIRVQSIMSRVYTQLREKINFVFPKTVGDSVDEVDGEADKELFQNPDKTRHIESSVPGYLQSLQSDLIFEIAQEHDLVICINFRPGEFVFEKESVASIAFDKGNYDWDEIEKKIVNALIIGRFPTSEQDVQFPINQLEEMAIRALSPGINDPHTARECIDYLASALSNLADRTFPSDRRYDEDGTLRIVTTGFTYEILFDAAFQRIHFYGKENPDIIGHLLHVFGKIIDAIPNDSARRSLVINKATTYYNDSKGAIRSEHDAEQIQTIYRKALKGTLTEIPTT